MSERHQAWWLIAVGGCLQVALAFHWELTPSEALTWAHTPWLSSWTQAFPPSLWAGAARLPGIGLHVLALLALSGWARRPRSMVVLGMCTPGLGGVALWASEVGWASSLWALALAGMLTQSVGFAWAGVCLGLGVSLGGEVAFIMGITVLACTTAFPASARRWSWPWACTTLGFGWAWGRPLALPLDGGDPIQTAIHLLLLAAPLLGLASIAAAPDARRRPERIAGRLAVSVAVGSGLANLWGWQVSATVTAVAWWAGALLLSSVDGRRRPLADAAVWLAPVSAAVVWLHTLRPLLPLTQDPATALRVGAPLGDDAMRWAMPVGVPRHGTRAREAVVWTDTDETAALVRFHTGIDAWTLGDCSRALPTTGDPVYAVSWSEGACVPPGWEATRIQRSPVHAPGGRDVGSWIWQEFRLAAP